MPQKSVYSTPILYKEATYRRDPLQLLPSPLRLLSTSNPDPSRASQTDYATPVSYQRPKNIISPPLQ